MRDQNVNFDGKTKTTPGAGEDASTAADASGKVGNDEHAEARRANTTPNCGPHLEVSRLHLEASIKSDCSIAGTTRPTYPYMYLLLGIGIDLSAPIQHRP